MKFSSYNKIPVPDSLSKCQITQGKKLYGFISLVFPSPDAGEVRSVSFNRDRNGELLYQLLLTSKSFNVKYYCVSLSGGWSGYFLPIHIESRCSDWKD